MKTKTVLILGGKDKGNDYTEIEDLVREKCSALVYLGLHNEKLHNFFDRMGLPVADVQTGMKDAVDAAFRLAKRVKPYYSVLAVPASIFSTAMKTGVINSKSALEPFNY